MIIKLHFLSALCHCALLYSSCVDDETCNYTPTLLTNAYPTFFLPLSASLSLPPAALSGL